jgi:hypothetical protein
MGSSRRTRSGPSTCSPVCKADWEWNQKDPASTEPASTEPIVAPAGGGTSNLLPWRGTEGHWRINGAANRESAVVGSARRDESTYSEWFRLACLLFICPAQGEWNPVCARGGGAVPLRHGGASYLRLLPVRGSGATVPSTEGGDLQSKEAQRLAWPWCCRRMCGAGGCGC